MNEGVRSVHQVTIVHVRHKAKKGVTGVDKDRHEKVCEVSDGACHGSEGLVAWQDMYTSMCGRMVTRVQLVGMILT